MSNEKSLKRKEWCESSYDLLRKPLPVYPYGTRLGGSVLWTVPNVIPDITSRRSHTRMLAY